MDWSLIREKLVRISMKIALIVYIVEENGEDVLQVQLLPVFYRFFGPPCLRVRCRQSNVFFLWEQNKRDLHVWFNDQAMSHYESLTHLGVSFPVLVANRRTRLEDECYSSLSL